MIPRVVPAGDAALIVEFDEVIDAGINARVVGLAARLRARAPAGVLDIVPTYRSVAVYFDPLETDVGALGPLIAEEAAAPDACAPEERPAVRIPVCYGGAFGPDLENVAERAGLTPDDVVALHAAGTYRVFMLGFAPGFPYLGLLDARISAPRLGTPRVRVPAGSVGIAGRQTGIYPIETPGGWQLIGRTPVRIFDAARTEPFLLAPGDSVQFVPIDRGRFETWS